MKFMSSLMRLSQAPKTHSSTYATHTSTEVTDVPQKALEIQQTELANCSEIKGCTMGKLGSFQATTCIYKIFLPSLHFCQSPVFYFIFSRISFLICLFRPQLRCAGSSLYHARSLTVAQALQLCLTGSWDLGLSCCTTCVILAAQPRTKPTSPSWACGLFASGSPGKSEHAFLYLLDFSFAPLSALNVLLLYLIASAFHLGTQMLFYMRSISHLPQKEIFIPYYELLEFF